MRTRPTITQMVPRLVLIHVKTVSEIWGMFICSELAQKENRASLWGSVNDKFYIFLCLLSESKQSSLCKMYSLITTSFQTTVSQDKVKANQMVLMLISEHLRQIPRPSNYNEIILIETFVKVIVIWVTKIQKIHISSTASEAPQYLIDLCTHK